MPRTGTHSLSFLIVRSSGNRQRALKLRSLPLSVSHTGAGPSLRCTLEPIDVNENLKEVLRLTRSDLIRRGVVVAYQLADDLPAATSDRVQLQQVLLNLITNACDAMETNPPAGD